MAGRSRQEQGARSGEEVYELQKPQSLPAAYMPAVEALGVGCSLGVPGLSAGF